jgi:hypothetical protein
MSVRLLKTLQVRERTRDIFASHLFSYFLQLSHSSSPCGWDFKRLTRLGSKPGIFLLFIYCLMHFHWATAAPQVDETLRFAGWGSEPGIFLLFIYFLMRFCSSLCQWDFLRLPRLGNKLRIFWLFIYFLTNFQWARAASHVGEMLKGCQGLGSKTGIFLLNIYFLTSFHWATAFPMLMRF